MMARCTLKVIFPVALLLTSCAAKFEYPDSFQKSHKVAQVQYQELPGWQTNYNPDFISYISPEQNVTVSIIHVGQVKTREEAALKAWRKLDLNFTGEIVADFPALQRGGWDEIREIEINTDNSQYKNLKTTLFLKNEEWKAILIHGSAATLEKQETAISSVVDSFEVYGYQAEDFSNYPHQSLSTEKLQDLKIFIEKAAKRLQVPGVGLAVIENGQVVLEEGIGVKDLQSQAPVTKHTKFMIASNTKGLTTLLLSKLVELKKVNWDDPVVQHYPKFKLGDEQTTKAVLLKHLVCACTGLPRKDLNWIFNDGINTPAQSVFEELANTQPTSRFGEIYQYNNQMAAAAGYIAGHILYPDLPLGQAYDKAMQNYIFTPLNMRDSTFSTVKAMQENHAKAYSSDIDGNVQLVEQSSSRGVNLSIIPHRPAGGLWSSVNDMSQYLQVELSAGLSLTGQRLFEPSTVLKRREHMVKSAANETYGMGLAVEHLSGIDIITHGGSMVGYKSNFFAIPSAQIGAVVLTNSDDGYFIEKLLKRKLIELIYDADPIADKMLNVFVEKSVNYKNLFKSNLTLPADSAIAISLAGEYKNAELGEISILVKDGAATLDTGLWQSQLATKMTQDSKYIAITTAPGLIGLEFILERDKGKKILTVDEGQHQYVFYE